MNKTEEKFGEVCQIARQNSLLQSTLALLEWDQQTKLPANAGKFRSEQITFLAGELHRRQTDPRLGELLHELSQSELMDDAHADPGATIRELLWNFERRARQPQELVEAMARASSVGQQVWVEARKSNDFAAFAPQLAEIVKLKIEQADAIGFDEQRYDALLNEYEPGASTAEVAAVLGSLRQELVPLIQQIADSGHQPDTAILNRHYPESSQRKFCRFASEKIGFDYQRGRLDVTHHPFCTELGPNDVRITTRYDESFFSGAFFGTLHEAGHGIYEQGLRGDQYGLPPGQFCSLGVHESQSRLWENGVGRSPEFWNHFFPYAQQHFGSTLADVSADSFVAAVNAVKPSLIRVEADEATYNLHIILRFELERQLVDGEIRAVDLPEIWNAKYQDYLAVTPDSDANGVLQDVHWSAGLIGYFPTYSLGNLFAAQLFEAATKSLGDLGPLFARGNFDSLRQWLIENVHRRGQCYRSRELVELVCGEPLSHAPLLRHLHNRLDPIYRLS